MVRQLIPVAALLTLLASPTSAQVEPDHLHSFGVTVRGVFTGADRQPLGPTLIYVEDGRIAALHPLRDGVAPESLLPPEVPVFDRSELVAAPGFILTQLAVGSGKRDASTISGRYRAIDDYDPYGAHRSLVSQGITTAFLHPGRGRLATGDGAVVKLDGPVAERILRARAEHCLEVGAAALDPPPRVEIPVPSSSDVPITPGERQRPSSRLTLIAELRARLTAALTYDEARDTRPAAERPDLDLDLQALADAALEGRLRIDARRATELEATLAFARELGLDVVVSGATEAYQALEALAQSGSTVIYEASSSLSGRARDRAENGDRIRPRADTPRLLAAAGIQFAITPPLGNEADLRLFAALAVRGGLAEADALAAITFDAAHALGVADRVGSIATEKDADFVLLSGHPLASSTEVMETYIGGHSVYRAPTAPGDSHALVVRAGTILTSAGAPIHDGEILIQDGVITAVGRTVPHPRGARVLDAGPEGVITPGFIDAFGHLGYEGEKKRVKANVPIHESVASAGPSFLRVARSGVTTVLTAPWALDHSGSRLTALKTAESKDPSDDLRRGLVLRESVGLAFDLRGNDPLVMPGALKARLGAGKAYVAKWKKYETELEAWKKAEAKKAEELVKKRRQRSWKKADAKENGKAPEAKPAGADDAGKKPEDAGATKPEDTPVPESDPISGTWVFTISGGPLPEPQSGNLLLKLEEDGETITGVVTREGQPEALPVSGRLDGTTVTLTLNVPTPFGAPKIKGEIVEEDVIRGAVNLGPLALVFEANRTERVVPEMKVQLKRRSKSGRPLPPPTDLTLEPLRRVIEGRGALAIRVDHPAAALTIMRALEALKLPVAFLGFDDADLVALELKTAGAGVLLSPERTVQREDRLHSPAADLAATGVHLGFMSDAEDGAADLPLRAVAAVARGADPGRALAALTIDVAKLFGIADRVGSLETGKDGDLLIWSGPPFEATSRLRSVVVGGRPVPQE